MVKSILRFTFLGAVLAAAAQAQNPTNGKALFIKHQCARCHGTDGQGGAGARLAPNPPTVAVMQKYVRNPTGAMPPYTNQVSDSDIADIRAYLASVPPPPAVKDIPLLNQ
jgi:mono/diheme cytochrome c family protein